MVTTLADPPIQTANFRQFAAVAIILLIAATGLNLHWSQDTKPTSVRNPVAELLPDTIVEQPFLDAFDDTGKKVRQLRGKQIQFFETDQRSVIISPEVEFEQQSNNQPAIPWRITANTATIYQANNKIELQGNVLLWSNATQGGRTEIATQQLYVDTARQFAETDKAVTIRARGSEAKAMGMQADLANDRLLLPSSVKEIHEVRR